MLRSFVSGWNRFWFADHDPRPAAAFRWTMGSLCTLMFVALWPQWDRFFAADGIISLNEPGWDNPRVDCVWGAFHWTEGLIPIGAWWFVGLALSVLFTVGLRTRWATVGLLLVIDAMLRRNPYVVNGEDLVMRMCLLYCVFVDLGAVWSVDAWLRRRAGTPARTALFGWPLRMLQINVALIYAISLPYKFVQDPGWITGDAVHWTVASDMWGPGTCAWITLAWNGWIRKAMTFGAVLVEGAFPLAVWFARTRRWTIAGVVTLHVSIAVLIPNVTFFTLSMVCAFAVFLTGADFDDAAGLWRRLRRGGYRTASRSPFHRTKPSMASYSASPSRS
jgi:hypothetical protein